MRDRDVRNVLRATLTAQHADDSDTIIIEELGLCEQSARIDVAVINGALTGFEIKSERDSLERLPTQKEFYSRVFDALTIVTHRTHLSGVRSIIPRWWGIIEAQQTDTDTVRLTHIREARPNRRIDSYSLAQLLWREEALRELQLRQLDGGVRSKKREAIWKRLADSVPRPELAYVVRETLKTRVGWRGRAQQT